MRTGMPQDVPVVRSPQVVTPIRVPRVNPRHADVKDPIDDVSLDMPPHQMESVQIDTPHMK